MNRLQWKVLESAEGVAQVACQRITELEQQAIQQHGQFRIVLAGGSTPQKVYQLLSEQTHDWQHWHIYFGDERCLPADDAARNSEMARQALLATVTIPSSQIYVIPAELGPEEAAQRYTRTIEHAMPFDLVLLGLGEDGHTASLFPGDIHPANQLVVPVNNAPKSPPQRVSLSARVLSECRHLLFLVVGDGKRNAVSRWRSAGDIPAASVGWLETGEVLLDQAAWNE